MKKKLAVFVVGTLAFSILLTGCQPDMGIETENLKITKYKNVEVEQIEKPQEVTDEAVDLYIDSVRRANARPTEEGADRPVQDGDTINIDFEGKVDGVAFEGGAAEDYPVTVGAGGFIEGFVESMVGHKPGETYDWNGAFPEGYGNADLAGKDVVFTITINSIEKEMPELTDEFVKTVSETSEMVEQYKKEIKEQFTKENEDEYKNQLREAVWQVVLDNSTVLKYPEEEVEDAADSIRAQYQAVIEEQGEDFDTFLEQSGITEEEFENQLREAGKSGVKQSMVLEAIAEKEGLTLSDEEYAEQLEAMAAAYAYEDGEALEREAGEEAVRERALYNVVGEWLIKHCVQVAQ